MPLVTIKIIEGRTPEQKKGMVADVTEAIVKNIGCPADTVEIDVVEMKTTLFAKGGKMWAETHK
jgi:4-oxalocrotonate tautomerase